jgi:hypothetical protein
LSLGTETHEKELLTLSEDCECSEYFSDNHSSVVVAAVLCIAVLQQKRAAMLNGQSFFLTVEHLSLYKVADYLKIGGYYLYLLGHFLQNV